MAISVTVFKQHCLEVVRQVERTGKPVAITRRGRGRWLATPGETFVREDELKGL